MFTLSLTVLPVFLLLLLGAFFQRLRFPMEDFWLGVDKLSYWVLFPALLFHNTSQIDFSNPLLAKYALILLCALFVTTLFVFSSTWLTKVTAPVASSMLQAGVRFNSFIVLALSVTLYGDEGLRLATLGAAVLIPSINLLLIISMVIMHGKTPENGSKLAAMPKLLSGALIRNPLILSIFLGCLVNVLGFSPIVLVSDVMEMLSRAALPLALLAVGASVKLKAIRSVGVTFVLSSIARFVIFTAVIGLMCWWLDIRGLPALVAMLFGLVPTATSGYALARQLGGDSDKIAVYIAMQTLLSVFTVPVSVWLSHYFFL
ncbi:AEC family transporter [Marinomonas sp. C2222]|uniref:AEC family transporter n=1 Tax=Marinomonas sargassi TaxID=2984494 RepID=A0ABT2YNK4_9GAMM|nr:AEC family transporter [Marinomonas sargassi]MCV2401470.1 AEC family transporter [Marinomonas sargassi]